ncbi:MAG: hypothetical protein EOP53_05230 [Sphingobacteriales bacterium]|nr:MAG: hypothetical protein EOP53_05230 [Sphingobacteriales bacterium]
METFIAILLYMQVIQSPGMYHQSHIDQLNTQFFTQINAIQNDPQQMIQVNQVYLPKVQDVVIIGWPDEAYVKPKNISQKTSPLYFI